ncbi:PREDICTED: uncharacterized protein LOC106811056 [Priapulus caudatus]|uniref:Uncharacterized protein LOC106811056 n=1 Tax=Priapulus caudatus TaxID=37621 RepID=A0ABM1ECZ3_PRICU|nr:PREDICTED: uncharacterized protein LOC106811056 [Priapulus caudatus]
MPIVPVKIQAKDKVVVTHAFLDSGSTASFCTTSLLDRLNMRGESTKFNLTTMSNTSERECQCVSMSVSSLDDQHFLGLTNVLAVETLPVSANDIPDQRDVDRWQHLQGVQVTSIRGAGVDLLIGNDNCSALEPQELNEQFKGYCNREFNDINIEAVEMSANDKSALSLMKDSTKMDGTHYEVGLPWKPDAPQLPNNRVLAANRLNLLGRRLSSNSDLHTKYKCYIDNLVERSFAGPVTSTQMTGKPGLTWYLPHHPVFHPQKLDKLRVVFDCSSKYRGVSLNEALYQGPDFTNSLTGVLTRFREGPIAFQADIESMFHQVHVPMDDRDAMRFLWWPGGDISKQPIDYRMNVHIFGAISSPSVCNYVLRRTATDNEGKFRQEAIDTVRKNFYVDDCLKSVLTEVDAILLIEDVHELLSKGGFRLTKFASNSRDVLASIPADERAVSLRELVAKDLPSERALGCWWDMEQDVFRYKTNVKQKPLTRRGILSVVSSIYDPLGLVAPYLLPAKFVSQDLCRLGLGWDDDIPDAYAVRWIKWLKDLPQLESMSIPRCVQPADFGRVTSKQLHHFADASERGYGAVSYLRLVNEDNDIQTALMMSKSRLAPLKTTTIPRLELSAATVAVQLDVTLRDELELTIDGSTFWTDSTTVLKYINNEESRFKTFVANRLSLIHEKTQPDQWRYVPGVLNPGDDASRGLDISTFPNDSRWSTGPEFLRKDESHWPAQESLNNVGNTHSSESDPEIKKSAFAQSVTETGPEYNAIVTAVERCSSWQKAKMVIARVKRFIACLKSAVEKRKNDGNHTVPSKSEYISVSEMREAEVLILQSVQRAHFPREMNSLERKTVKRGYVHKSSVIRKLDPVMDNGLLKVGGRLKHSNLPDSAKNPIILPHRGHLTDIIVRSSTSNFVGAERELREAILAWNQSDIEAFLLQRETEWKFNPPSGSHFGGVWERWITEYLPLLQERQKWLVPTRNLAIGDIVLVADNNVPRCSWPLGRVLDVFPGNDGRVRSVSVKTNSVNPLTRPVDKLVLLELDD